MMCKSYPSIEQHGSTIQAQRPVFTPQAENGSFLHKTGHGFRHGPVAGKLMVDVSMLDLKRFEEGRWITGYNVV
jgi:hypothetical protein